tara:strand:- start:139 stop:381 length:243 start_codon:yes stop_codon:yes gene_type:complete
MRGVNKMNRQETKLGIFQYPHGIMLNEPEWVLEGGEDSDVATFDTAEEAVSFLNEKTGEEYSEGEWEELGLFIGDIEDES